MRSEDYDVRVRWLSDRVRCAFNFGNTNGETRNADSSLDAGRIRSE
jgi:hypothetical protein